MARNHGRPKGRKGKPLPRKVREQLRRQAEYRKKLARMSPQERELWHV